MFSFEELIAELPVTGGVEWFRGREIVLRNQGEIWRTDVCVRVCACMSMCVFAFVREREKLI